MAYSSSYIICIILFVLPYSPLAQGNGTVSVGSSLTAADKATSWYSLSGDFEFGFKKVQDQYLLSIWYDKIPDKTVVWFVNDGTTVPAGSRVQLTADHGLVLSDSNGKEFWRSGMLAGTASKAVFNDTGNFMIFYSRSEKLWDSFSNPTDTLLPTQTLGINGALYFRLSETNFTRGRFQFRFLDNGNLVLNIRDVLTNYAYFPYYGDDSPGTNDTEGSQLQFSTAGYMYIVKGNDATDNLTPLHVYC
nr:PREDICTED: G-type lectin S-receptor-like serine/threonine-protein kinase RLK1 [Daucus carota subsp. sativus]